MLNLANSMAPNEYNRFTSRVLFTVRQSDKYWCGIWTDISIEQVLMRSLKTSGGLTRGCTMETFGGVACATSGQHVDLRKSSQRHDHSDTATFLSRLNLHNSFQRASPLLASLSSGVVANAAVNYDDALSVGEASMMAMEGKLFSEIHVQRNTNVRPFQVRRRR